MKRIKLLASSVGLLMLPVIASAQLATTANGGALQNLLETIVDFANTVLIPFIIAIGFLVFVWGMFQFFILGGANDESKEKGKSLMVWATVGFVLIIIFWGIINLLATSTGLDKDPSPTVPAGPKVGAT